MAESVAPVYTMRTSSPAAEQKLIEQEINSLTPQQIVVAFLVMYSNLASASSQLSRFKRRMRTKGLDDKFLSALKLKRKDYNDLMTTYKTSRDMKSRDVILVRGVDDIVSCAQHCMCSSDYRVLWGACILMSGFRPADLMTVSIAFPKQSHVNADYWISVVNVAKKKTASAEKSFEHPLLCPRELFLRAVSIVRLYFEKHQAMTKEGMSQRYSKYWSNLVRRSYPSIPKVTHVTLRRLYAKYAFVYFKNDFLPSIITEHAFISFALMHESNDPALSYGNLALCENDTGKLDLLKNGRALIPFIEKK